MRRWHSVATGQAGETALALLRKAEALEASTVKDAELHTELGFLEQASGNIHAADREYRAALAADPDDGTARGDMAVLFAGTGDYATAVRLWQRVFECGSGAERRRATTWRWDNAGWGREQTRRLR